MAVASPAHDYVGHSIDLQEALMPNPVTTFLIRATGSVPEAKIFDDDILLVDRDLSPWSGAIVVVALDGELLIRQWHVDRTNTAWLIALGTAPEAAGDGIRFTNHPDVVLWGVINVAIRELRPKRSGRTELRGIGPCPRAKAHSPLSYM